MTNKQNNDCSIGKFKRLNYYHGMLLTEHDFQAEQYYFREKMKLHNRMHGYGVVWGLETTSRCTKIDGKQVHKIFIEPGFALDCEGNEIIVCNPYLVPIDEKIDQLTNSCEPLNPCTKLLIAIKYCECKSEPQPQYATECGDEDQQVQFSRIREGFSVQVLLEDEVPDCCKKEKQDDCCEKYKQDCSGLAVCCAEEHMIILGCICIDQESESSSYDSYQEMGLGDENSKKSEYSEKAYIGSSTLVKGRIRIDPCCEPPRVCKPCSTPQDKWEQQKQKLLHEARKVTGNIDFCDVIGKSVCDAECYLKELKLNVTEIKKRINDYDYSQLQELIEEANCYAMAGNSITLITDEQCQCVVFAYVNSRVKEKNHE